MVYAESLRSFVLPANLKRKAVQVFVAVVLATPALVKPPPASAIIRGSSFYTLVHGPSWTEAEADAVQLGGHLATINSAFENDWLFQNGILGWIGFTDAPQEGVWRWTSGQSVTYTNWDNPSNPSNNWGAEHYAYIDGGAGYWNDVPDTYWLYGNPFTSSPNMGGIAEIPITFSASQSASPIEGSGLFTTSLFFSAGVGSNLVNGEKVYWGLDGITADDLSSGTMSGFGVVTNGRLDIIHSLFDDGVDEIENFIVTAYSDPLLRTSEYQIGSYSAPVRSASSSTASVPGPLPILGLSSVFYWTRRLRKRIKNNKATL
jgi:Lectin C-type domain